jgi:glycosyltransferase involved in cell wall biosynthesis
LLFVVSEDWYFVSHRLHLAETAIAAGYKVALLSRISQHRAQIEASGVEVLDWSLDRRSRNPFMELRALWVAYGALRRFRPDIVHAVALKPVLYSALACRLAGVHARVSALGGLGFVFSSRKFLARLLRPVLVRAFRWALSGGRSRLILQNPDDQATLLTAGVIEVERIRLIRGAGVDTSDFSPQAELSDVPLVVLPARLLWDKGVGVFVDCARSIKQKGLAARFVLVGEPDEHNPECVPVAQLEVWMAEGAVEWWGRRADMPDVLRQAAVVCLPSSYGEGLPKALLEAASCGRPIVTYDVPGCREVVVDGKNGFLVPLKDEQALVIAVEKLLCDPELRRRMGVAGREMVLREFSQEKVAAETMRVWEEVLA